MSIAIGTQVEALDVAIYDESYHCLDKRFWSKGTIINTYQYTSFGGRKLDLVDIDFGTRIEKGVELNTPFINILNK